jgi:DNA mismatch repair protein MSH4
MLAELKYENNRQYYLRISESEFLDRQIPQVLINIYRTNRFIQCQTMTIIKLNQRIVDSHNEIVLMSDKTIQQLLDDIRGQIPNLFKICEGIALLDMIASFGQVVTTQTQDYVRPEFTELLTHMVQVHLERFVPNDVYASEQSRFQIVTGCNMSGKSTYIRSVALMCVMAQVGCFVPARYASFPMIHQLFARVSVDDNLEANASTFASEMRETAFILRHVGYNIPNLPR